jgi:hypothetical protein
MRFPLETHDKKAKAGDDSVTRRPTGSDYASDGRWTEAAHFLMDAIDEGAEKP